jgi:hypothetical protein
LPPAKFAGRTIGLPAGAQRNGSGHA